MRVPSKLSLATLALVGACSANTMAKPDDNAGAAPVDTISTTARDDSSAMDTSTTTARDTTAQNPPGYRGMERDTTMVPPNATTQPVDTFLQRQGTGAPQDTMGYGGLERDTTGQGQARETETTSDSSGRTVPGMAQPDSTSGQQSMDSTSGMDTTRTDSSSTGR
jgi:hypothetical protein